MSKTNPTHGTVITASYQTNGKGQYGRKWESKPDESILLSLILKHDNLLVTDVFYLNICISLSIHKFISNYTDKSVKIKWPNDIYVDNKKIAGILIQNQISGQKTTSSIVGIGININQKQFDIADAIPVSLTQITGKTFTTEELIDPLLRSINKYYKFLIAGNHKGLKSEYLQHLYKFQTFAQYKLSDNTIIKAKIIDINKNGSIVLDINGRRKSYSLHELRMIVR